MKNEVDATAAVSLIPTDTMKLEERGWLVDQEVGARNTETAEPEIKEGLLNTHSALVEEVDEQLDWKVVPEARYDVEV